PKTGSITASSIWTIASPWDGERVLPLFEGVNLSLYSVSRANLLRIKLFAACDRAEGMTIDLPDIKSMNPNPDEIVDASQWVRRELSRQRRPSRENQQFLQTLAAVEKVLEQPGD